MPIWNLTNCQSAVPTVSLRSLESHWDPTSLHATMPSGPSVSPYPCRNDYSPSSPKYSTPPSLSELLLLNQDGQRPSPHWTVVAAAPNAPDALSDSGSSVSPAKIHTAIKREYPCPDVLVAPHPSAVPRPAFPDSLRLLPATPSALSLCTSGEESELGVARATSFALHCDAPPPPTFVEDDCNVDETTQPVGIHYGPSAILNEANDRSLSTSRVALLMPLGCSSSGDSFHTYIPTQPSPLQSPIGQHTPKCPVDTNSDSGFSSLSGICNLGVSRCKCQPNPLSEGKCTTSLCSDKENHVPGEFAGRPVKQPQYFGTPHTPSIWNPSAVKNPWTESWEGVSVHAPVPLRRRPSLPFLDISPPRIPPDFLADISPDMIHLEFVKIMPALARPVGENMIMLAMGIFNLGVWGQKRSVVELLGLVFKFWDEVRRWHLLFGPVLERLCVDRTDGAATSSIHGNCQQGKRGVSFLRGDCLTSLHSCSQHLRQCDPR